MTNNSRRTLLVIDDQNIVRASHRDAAEDMGWHVIEAFDANSIQSALSTPPDAILLDLSMPSMTGVEVLEVLADRNITSQIVIASGLDDQFLNMAMRRGRALGLNMVARLSKPIPPKKLEDALRALWDKVG